MIIEQTSISDYSAYRNTCQLIADNLEAFEVFKQNPVYNTILEHASRDQAMRCIDIIRKGPLDLSKIKLLRTNDEQGTPTLETYGDELFDNISPSTIRYIKVLSDLIHSYGGLDDFNIVEIGIGYGGQCKLINDYSKIQSYSLVDLPEVLNLAKRYLSKYDYKSVNKWAGEGDVEYDLVISNYAITECNREVQRNYIENIVNKSAHGYITCNYVSSGFGINSMTKDEFIGSITHEVTVSNEVPLTYPGNILLTW